MDGNVLVAIAMEAHEHHDVALRWFAEGHGLASCPMTQGTLLRMLVRAGHGADEAMLVLDSITGNPRHEFWPDALPFTARVLAGVQGHRQVTDAYLAELVRRRGGRLVTLDRGLAVTHGDVAELIS